MMDVDQFNLFDVANSRQILAPGAVVLRGRITPLATTIMAEIDQVAAQAPFRQMMTPGGLTMSVAMTNCGARGWVSDRKGYRYAARDPLTGQAWPPMPPYLFGLAAQLAAEAGYPDFAPDACLINRYESEAKLSLHQDKDEQDLTAPIVSLSLGLPAVFLWGGMTRAEKPLKIGLLHGDVVVWGGPSRLAFHGIAPIKKGSPSHLGSCRFNLTFRRALSLD